MRKRSNLIRQVIGILLLLASLILLIKPEFDDLLSGYRAKAVRESIVSYKKVSEGYVPTMQSVTENPEYSIDDEYVVIEAEDQVWQSLRAYNEMLGDKEYQKSQIEYKSSSGFWSEEDVFGTIEIPSIDVDLPLYIETSDENLSKGAAVLEGTSFPIGGADTNCVISGHRGWKGASYFKEIENVNYGDEIIITNPWETLIYRVEGMSIIEPTEIDQVMVKDDADMITLVTCHPYRSPRNLRYVVYAKRETNAENDTVIGEENDMPVREEELNSSNLQEYEEERIKELIRYGSSADEIRWEKWIRRGGAAVLVILLLGWLFYDKRQKQHPC